MSVAPPPAPIAGISSPPGLMWRLWNEALGIARAHPAVFFPLMRLRMTLPHSPRWSLVAPDTEIVIEGYWRSGNTFAVRAFQATQGRPVRTAYHTHAAATIQLAVRRGLPTIVLIRPPLEAVSARVLLAPRIPPRYALHEYIRYYRAIASFRAGFLVATFDELTGDFGRLVARVNARFGTGFRVPDGSADEFRDVPRESTADLPHLAQYPREWVADWREVVRDRLRRDPLLRLADRVYRRFCAGSDRPGDDRPARPNPSPDNPVTRTIGRSGLGSQYRPVALSPRRPAARPCVGAIKNC